MGKNTVDVTDATFDADVLDSDKTVVVDFWATWCGPCKMVAPVLDEIAGEHKDKMTVAKLDIDENPATARDYQVMSIPTMIVFQDGKPVKQIVGAKPKAALLSRPRRLPGLTTHPLGAPDVPFRGIEPSGRVQAAVLSRAGHARTRPAAPGRGTAGHNDAVAEHAPRGATRRARRARGACSCCAEVTAVPRSSRSARRCGEFGAARPPRRPGTEYHVRRRGRARASAPSSSSAA